MFKKPVAIIGFLFALIFCNFNVHASQTYNFAYTFLDLSKVTGSFDGNANGNIISDISNISVLFNGTPINGGGNTFQSEKIYQFGPGDCSWYCSGTAVVSFDGTQNNFMFVDHVDPQNTRYNSIFFSLRNSSSLTTNYTGVSTGGLGASDEPYGAVGQTMYSASRWSVTAVPEPETFVLLLTGIGMIGAVVKLRKANKA